MDLESDRERKERYIDKEEDIVFLQKAICIVEKTKITVYGVERDGPLMNSL